MFQLEYPEKTTKEHLRFLFPFNALTATEINNGDENECNSINTVIS